MELQFRSLESGPWLAAVGVGRMWLVLLTRFKCNHGKTMLLLVEKLFLRLNLQEQKAQVSLFLASLTFKPLSSVPYWQGLAGRGQQGTVWLVDRVRARRMTS